MKNKNILYIIFGILFVAVFFLNIFPYPVKVEGVKTFWNQWVFTSILYQLKVKAWIPSFIMLGLFSTPFLAIKLWR